VEAAVAYLRYYHGIYLEELKKTTKNLSQDSRCLGRDSNRDPPEYMSEALPLELCLNLLPFCYYTDEVAVHYCHYYSINTYCSPVAYCSINAHGSINFLYVFHISHHSIRLIT
jgi:hypothetical protein